MTQYIPDESLKSDYFFESDVKERKYWNKDMQAFEQMLAHTNTNHASWHVNYGLLSSSLCEMRK